MLCKGDKVKIISSGNIGILQSIDIINNRTLYTVEIKGIDSHISRHELFQLGKLMVSCREDELEKI